jgi:hypothetical protein
MSHLVSLVTFFTLACRFLLGFAQNSFEKWLVAACRFSKKVYANQRMLQPTVLGELHSAVFKRA